MEIPTMRFKSANRIGNLVPDRKRPIKVTMISHDDKNKVMQSLTNLKNKTMYKGVSITDDYTPAERQMLKEWSDKAKVKNGNEEENYKYVWRVRGTPKNGLLLKRFLKRV